MLRTAAGTYVQVVKTRRWTAYQRVHNLTIDTTHTFYVIARNTPILVHNAPGCTVLERFRDVTNYVDQYGGNRLNMPWKGLGKWWGTKNRRFMQNAIHRGDEIVLANGFDKTSL